MQLLLPPSASFPHNSLFCCGFFFPWQNSPIFFSPDKMIFFFPILSVNSSQSISKWKNIQVDSSDSFAVLYLEFQNDTLGWQWAVEVSPAENKEDLEKRQQCDYTSAKSNFNFLEVDVVICKLLFCDKDPMSHMQLKYK